MLISTPTNTKVHTKHFVIFKVYKLKLLRSAQIFILEPKNYPRGSKN